MTKEELLNKAMLIAFEAHKKQVDKNGQPYVGHIFRVMNMGKTMDEKICGVLHDIVEDTDWTFEKLEAEGFPQHIIDALKCLTKLSEDEPYEDFINRVRTSDLAKRVKINDLSDNLDVKRYNELAERELNRLNKYLHWYKVLVNNG
ncbi:MAG: phosphohydrolase [Melioribacter sp.]|uniref:phosphohydrolase n=1 Tax=Rosettibacter primus TaxID=3111523 RepID=UPI00247CCEF3|nr:phosphohydrolase [Melioribacter sp.]